MYEKDKGNLLSIMDSCLKIEVFTDEFSDADSFFNDDKSFDAVLMNFVIIGEAVSRLSEKLKAEENRISWGKIKNFRNIVAHDYFGVDAEEVWQIVKNDLPVLKADVLQILEKS
jgi:uncharacterized protein with HEPN domain